MYIKAKFSPIEFELNPIVEANVRSFTGNHLSEISFFLLSINHNKLFKTHRSSYDWQLAQS